MKTKTPSPRQLKVGEEVKHILANILQRQEILDPVLNANFITISQVAMTADLKLANCYFTVLNSSSIKEVENSLKKNSKAIKYLCAKQLKQLKYIPDIRFFYDNSINQFTKINDILKTPEVQQDLNNEE